MTRVTLMHFNTAIAEIDTDALPRKGDSIFINETRYGAKDIIWVIEKNKASRVVVVLEEKLQRARTAEQWFKELKIISDEVNKKIVGIK